ncbi:MULTISPECIES: DUF1257 domain-containing protein [unclassified Tolypothrix]|uniref:DUF1257 domain-containing protein n=1 Tax=unclassified Tolypothrix TaxID=2649714 RepID=UPI0005EAAE38|nr:MULTISPECIES: DUF1257 domain-containing protein [unclassified Tolypothrix]BAY93769.1 hypothetical protein NIES3275_58110 [Microchaete diplosiphon NIES-3275]EKF03313.1 hypothetical protein FDUTEX481_02672 [Tolypothrix sp. PCC 7601]MBE9087258.1 DUF1257 domain-containing protein [Tolypothrix sp. LEGE 11397]UYD27568.1 DUF1257 domain-containing protein [Tolypothrix sp. PCC 7712]UYD36571.1 DUF1257 domain-containing protein [Tolypothrix sp. PCC 7601]
MSHFSTVKTKLTNCECLVQALQDLKLLPEVYETPHPLKGYYGNQERQSAEIVIPNHTLKVRADIGFRWNATDGAYQLIHDAYETVPKLGQNFFTHQLMQVYGKRMVRAKAAQLQEQFGECSITEESNGQVQTLRLTFAAHQQTQQYLRR